MIARGDKRIGPLRRDRDGVKGREGQQYGEESAAPDVPGCHTSMIDARHRTDKYLVNARCASSLFVNCEL